jgi:creatinine amidohydrolase
MSREIDLFSEPIGHGEEIETSHMLHRCPHSADLVQEIDNPGQKHHLYHVDPADNRDSLCHLPVARPDMEKFPIHSGDIIIHCPTRATATKGAGSRAHLVARQVEVLERPREC